MRIAWPRAFIAVLLVGGAYLAARRWLECAFPPGIPAWSPELARECTFGFGDQIFDRGGPGPLWQYLLVGAIYVIAAAWVLRTKRLA